MRARNSSTGGIGYGFDTSDNSGSVAPGRGAQMAPQQKLGIRTERRYWVTSYNRVGSLDAWSVLEAGNATSGKCGEAIGK